jgi:hypothetical protein
MNQNVTDQTLSGTEADNGFPGEMLPGTFLAESSRCQTQDSKLSRFREEYMSVKMKQVSELQNRNSGSIL